jgi:4-phosphopantoate--beta-alanine ligase
MTKIEVPADHPRKASLDIREKIIEGHDKNIVATAGLLAHGRGEAFDYMIGEITNTEAKDACRAAVAVMLLAKHPVISVNGNVCALVADEIVELSELTKAPLEINLFYYQPEREDAILEALLAAGAKDVLGTHDRPSEIIPELSSNRRKVDSEGIAKADVVLVPLEDGDRTEALKAIDKFVITVDLNPMSRTAVFSDITIVDNIVRAAPLMVQYAHEMKDWPREKLDALVAGFDNQKNLSREMFLMKSHLDNQIDSTYKEDEP